MISANRSFHSARIVVEVNVGIPEYLIQTKRKILFFKRWHTLRENNFFGAKKIRFDSFEKAKSYIKGSL